MKIVKYIVEVSIEEWKASPHIHKYPYDTMGDTMRVMIPKDDYESLFLRPGNHETYVVCGRSFDVIAVDHVDGTGTIGCCSRCCFNGDVACEYVVCDSSERPDGRDVYFQPWQK